MLFCTIDLGNGSDQSDTVVAQSSHRAGDAGVPTGYKRISIGEAPVSWFGVVKLCHNSDRVTRHVDNLPLALLPPPDRPGTPLDPTEAPPRTGFGVSRTWLCSRSAVRSGA